MRRDRLPGVKAQLAEPLTCQGIWEAGLGFHPGRAAGSREEEVGSKPLSCRRPMEPPCDWGGGAQGQAGSRVVSGCSVPPRQETHTPTAFKVRSTGQRAGCRRIRETNYPDKLWRRYERSSSQKLEFTFTPFYPWGPEDSISMKRGNPLRCAPPTTAGRQALLVHSDTPTHTVPTRHALHTCYQQSI